ncbi:ROK family protein [Cellulomonas aerilata]|uniref:NagC family transcriptional regulator n=1 Tax=Cellulomonas aerilata TaxID=515326 RepID=A0A512DH54_9CELL|nr:ROK family protein [Cellulomonas aerilata]GEO35795.1 NagC family transcriptional regulator [Cellulomonas aerilata]
MTAPAGPGGTGWSVGLDIGGTKISAVLVDETSTVRSALRMPTRHGVSGVVGSAAEATHRLCAQADVTPGELAAVGVGVPGMVDTAAGTVTHAVNLGVHGDPLPLGRLLGEELRRSPVRVENDLNVAALGASELLHLDGDLAFLALGTGVGAGLVLDGQLRRGHRGGAGEIGHLPFRADGPTCLCGQRGCLELYASGSAIAAAWPSRTGRPAPAEVFEAAASGDADALRIRDDVADAVAAAVRMLVLMCDVRHVVLGGGVAQLGMPLLEAVTESLRVHAAGSPFLESMHIADRLVLSPRGGEVAPLGAALAARPAGARRPAPAPAR